jgi:hypothetical protein
MTLLEGLQRGFRGCNDGVTCTAASAFAIAGIVDEQKTGWRLQPWGKVSEPL